MKKTYSVMFSLPNIGRRTVLCFSSFDEADACREHLQDAYPRLEFYVNERIEYNKFNLFNAELLSELNIVMQSVEDEILDNVFGKLDL